MGLHQSNPINPAVLWSWPRQTCYVFTVHLNHFRPFNFNRSKSRRSDSASKWREYVFVHERQADAKWQKIWPDKTQHQCLKAWNCPPVRNDIIWLYLVAVATSVLPLQCPAVSPCSKHPIALKVSQVYLVDPLAVTLWWKITKDLVVSSKQVL